MTSIHPPISAPTQDRSPTEHAYVHINALAAYRDALTAQINQHAEDAAMWISPESTGWGLLTLTQRVQLTREHLDQIERLTSARDKAIRTLTDARRRHDRNIP